MLTLVIHFLLVSLTIFRRSIHLLFYEWDIKHWFTPLYKFWMHPGTRFLASIPSWIASVFFVTKGLNSLYLKSSITYLQSLLDNNIFVKHSSYLLLFTYSSDSKNFIQVWPMTNKLLFELDPFFYYRSWSWIIFSYEWNPITSFHLHCRQLECVMYLKMNHIAWTLLILQAM